MISTSYLSTFFLFFFKLINQYSDRSISCMNRSSSILTQSIRRSSSRSVEARRQRMPAQSPCEEVLAPPSPINMAPDTTLRSATVIPSTTLPLTKSATTVELQHTVIPDNVLACLSQSHVRIKNKERALGKIAKMIQRGRQELIVISDFDHTLSRAYDEKGERCWTTHGVFDNAEKLATLAQKCKDLSQKYLPIEFDGNMSIAEKIPHMEAWWRKSHDAIVEQGINRDMLEELVLKSNIRLRDHSNDMLKQLQDNRVPLVMFSAGIGDIITIFLSQRLGAVPSNMHLISNMMIFNDKSEISGFREPLIHTFNKNGTVIKQEREFFHEMEKRSNVILMGDSMGDLHMDVGVENHKEADTLKIGFLNKKDHLLPYYLDGYDIVILDDQSMTVPHSIMSAIVAN